MGHKGPFGAVLGHFGTITEISVKNGVWGPVEWVGDQLTGWGGVHPEPKFENKWTLFFEIF